MCCIWLYMCSCTSEKVFGKVSIVQDNYVWTRYIFKSHSNMVKSASRTIVMMITSALLILAAGVGLIGCSCSHYFILSLLETGVQFSQLSVRDYSSLSIFFRHEQFLHLQQFYMEKKSHRFTKTNKKPFFEWVFVLKFKAKSKCT